MENLPRRGFADTCCACSFMSFRWEIVRDSPLVNIVSRTVKFMLPGNTKCSLTSLADTKEDRFIYGASNFAAG